MEFRSTPEFGSEFRSAPELNSGVLLNSFKSLDRQASQSFRCNRHTVFNGRQMASRLAAARTVNDVQTPIQACLPMLLWNQECETYDSFFLDVHGRITIEDQVDYLFEQHEGITESI